MKFILVFLLLGLSACTSLGPKFSEEKLSNKNKSLLYVYRIKRFMGGAGSPYICLDGKVIGELPNGGYFRVEISPGKHAMWRKVIGGEMGNFHFRTSPGKTYYVRNEMSIDSGAQEGVDAGMATVGGGGAVGGLAAMAFEGDKNDKARVLKNIDKRAQKSSVNPGFLAVAPKFAQTEITNMKLFRIPKYKKNYCQRKKAKK